MQSFDWGLPRDLVLTSDLLCTHHLQWPNPLYLLCPSPLLPLLLQRFHFLSPLCSPPPFSPFPANCCSPFHLSTLPSLPPLFLLASPFPFPSVCPFPTTSLSPLPAGRGGPSRARRSARRRIDALGARSVRKCGPTPGCCGRSWGGSAAAGSGSWGWVLCPCRGRPGSGGEPHGTGPSDLGELGRRGEELGSRCCVYEPPSKPSARRAAASAQAARLDPGRSGDVDESAFNLLNISASMRWEA